PCHGAKPDHESRARPACTIHDPVSPTIAGDFQKQCCQCRIYHPISRLVPLRLRSTMTYRYLLIPPSTTLTIRNAEDNPNQARCPVRSGWLYIPHDDASFSRHHVFGGSTVSGIS